MTALEHAVLATGLLAIFFYYGKWLGRKEKTEDIIETTLNTLEVGNFIKVKIHDNGEKELIPLDKVS
jgi:hypothetical protein